MKTTNCITCLMRSATWEPHNMDHEQILNPQSLQEAIHWLLKCPLTGTQSDIQKLEYCWHQLENGSKSNFILFERHWSRNRKRESSICCFTAQKSVTAEIEPDWSQEPGIRPGFPMWVDWNHKWCLDSNTGTLMWDESAPHAIRTNAPKYPPALWKLEL